MKRKRGEFKMSEIAIDRNAQYHNENDIEIHINDDMHDAIMRAMRFMHDAMINDNVHNDYDDDIDIIEHAAYLISLNDRSIFDAQYDNDFHEFIWGR